MQYVALFYSNGCLGRTILCQSWSEAVANCVRLANQSGVSINKESLKTLELEGELDLSELGVNGCVHIGQLEPAD